MWKSGDFKTDYVGVYSKADWEKAKSFEGMSKGAGGLYKHGDDFGAIIKMSGDISNKHDKVTLGKYLATEPTLRSVYRHEFGYFVHLRGLSKSQANEWEDIWGSSSVSKSSVSKYAMTNSKEFFAESFAAYTSKVYSSSKKKLPTEIEVFFKKVLR